VILNSDRAIAPLSVLVHHFDLPSRHGQLTIISDALVNIDAQPSVPELMDYQGWSDLEQLVEKKDYWDMLMPSHFARPSAELDELAKEIGATERDGRSPLAFLQDLASGVHRSFGYVKKRTAVSSPIEHALRSRQGVCQDFAHVMIALVRNAKIPCRYVSGYLYNSSEDAHPSADGATHAWVEALLPGVGWVGFDPTINRLVGEGHSHRNRSRLCERSTHHRRDEGKSGHAAPSSSSCHAVPSCAPSRRGVCGGRRVVPIS
jgi:transglutaminase-like putative cysteine protease